jgi:ribose transport system permease protein
VTTTTQEKASLLEDLRRVRLPGMAGPLLVLIVLVVGLAIINPRFLSSVNLANLARQASVLAILAIGETFIILMASIDLSIEGNIAITSVIIGMLAKNYFNDNNYGLLAVLLAIAAAVLMGFLNGLFYTRLRIPSFMATLGMMYVGLGLGTWLSGGMNLPLLDEMILSWARGTTGPIPNLAFFGLGAVLLGLFLEKYTRFGRYVFAIGGAEDRARLAGVPIERYKILAFTVAGLFFGVGGVLNTARIGAGTSTAGLNQLFAAITAVVLGNGMVLAGVHSFTQLAVQGVIITVAVILTLDRSKLPFVK